jgi:hypothetical protein
MAVRESAANENEISCEKILDWVHGARKTDSQDWLSHPNRRSIVGKSRWVTQLWKA